MSKAILASIIDKAKDQIVEKYADDMVDHIQSDDFKEQLASKINKKLIFLLLVRRKNRYSLRSVLTLLLI